MRTASRHPPQPWPRSWPFATLPAHSSQPPARQPQASPLQRPVPTFGTPRAPFARTGVFLTGNPWGLVAAPNLATAPARPNQQLVLAVPAASPAGRSKPKSRYSHPLNWNIEINKGPLLKLDPASAYERIAQNTSALHWASITAGSHNSYQTGWNHWISWTKFMDTDRFLQLIPEVFLARELFTLSFVETIVVGFMMFLRFDRKVTPDTIAQYMSAVRYQLGACGIEAVHTKSAQIGRILRGLKLEWLKEPGNSKAERQHLAFTPDMIRKTGAELDLTDDKNFAILVAVRTAFQFLTRVGELVFVSTSQDHYIKGKSIMFVIRTDTNSRITISSVDAHNYLLAQVESVIVDIKDAKNDPEGVGFRYQLDKRTPEQLVHEDSFCICSSLFECATRLRPSPNESFFQTTTAAVRQWQIKDSDITKFVKRGAVLCGFDPKRFTTHCPRIAGASALAALDAPSWYIKLAGRWTTEQYLTYIRMSSKSMEEYMSRMQSSINSQDIHRWNPSLGATPLQIARV